ncbi:hypothetical protein ACMC56_16710 (plasmid) [Campylobacterota bacterium DY0563]
MQRRFTRQMWDSYPSEKGHRRNTGRVLENAVYLHLRSRYDVCFGKNGREVDFVLCDNLKPVKVLNVTYEARDGKTVKREVSG